MGVLEFQEQFLDFVFSDNWLGPTHKSSISSNSTFSVGAGGPYSRVPASNDPILIDTNRFPSNINDIRLHRIATSFANTKGECQKDYEIPCPKNWCLTPDQACRSPFNWIGPCPVRSYDLARYSRKGKEEWEKYCGVSYPCKNDIEAHEKRNAYCSDEGKHPGQMVVQPINTETEQKEIHIASGREGEWGEIYQGGNIKNGALSLPHYMDTNYVHADGSYMKANYIPGSLESYGIDKKALRNESRGQEVQEPVGIEKQMLESVNHKYPLEISTEDIVKNEHPIAEPMRAPMDMKKGAIDPRGVIQQYPEMKMRNKWEEGNQGIKKQAEANPNLAKSLAS